MSRPWCSICSSYHEPQDSLACHRSVANRGKTGGTVRYPRAYTLATAVLVGVLCGFPLGALTKKPLIAAVAWLIGTVAYAIWQWPRDRS